MVQQLHQSRAMTNITKYRHHEQTG